MDTETSGRRLFENTVEPSYNDIGLCNTSSILSDILLHKLIPYS